MNKAKIASSFLVISFFLLLLFSWSFLCLYFVKYSEQDIARPLLFLTAAFSFFNFGMIVLLWVLVLAKQFSTHSMQFMDIGTAIKQKQKEKESDWASEITEHLFAKRNVSPADMVNKNENLKDSLV